MINCHHCITASSCPSSSYSSEIQKFSFFHLTILAILNNPLKQLTSSGMVKLEQASSTLALQFSSSLYRSWYSDTLLKKDDFEFTEDDCLKFKCTMHRMIACCLSSSSKIKNGKWQQMDLWQKMVPWGKNKKWLTCHCCLSRCFHRLYCSHCPLSIIQFFPVFQVILFQVILFRVPPEYHQVFQNMNSSKNRILISSDIDYS